MCAQVCVGRFVLLDQLNNPISIFPLPKAELVIGGLDHIRTGKKPELTLKPPTPGMV